MKRPRKGDHYRVLGDPSKRATAITARPLDSSRFETEFVSADDRAEQHYAGYYLVLSFEQLGEHFKPVAG